jgi:hypothetical protein
MTLIVGALTADGALMAGDCRVTWAQRSGDDIAADFAQKIIQLGAANTLGFSGHVPTAQTLLWIVLEQFKHRRRKDPMSLRQWLPRLLRRAYKGMARLESIDHVELMVAGSLAGRPAAISADRLWKLIGQTSALDKNNILALRCFQSWTDSNTVWIPDSSAAILYVMRAPRFEPEHCYPFDVAAIGSGAAKALPHLNTYKSLIMSSDSFGAADALLTALQSYLVETPEESVGGAVILTQAERGRVDYWNQSSHSATGVEVRKTDHGWRVRNKGTGQEVTLKGPLEIPRTHPWLLFDVMRETLESAREEMRARKLHFDERLARLDSE